MRTSFQPVVFIIATQAIVSFYSPRYEFIGVSHESSSPLHRRINAFYRSTPSPHGQDGATYPQRIAWLTFDDVDIMLANMKLLKPHMKYLLNNMDNLMPHIDTITPYLNEIAPHLDLLLPYTDVLLSQMPKLKPRIFIYHVHGYSTLYRIICEVY